MIFENVKNYCLEKGLSIAAFEKLCDIGNGTVARWENSKSKPSLQSLEKMQEATGVSIADWVK